MRPEDGLEGTVFDLALTPAAVFTSPNEEGIAGHLDDGATNVGEHDGRGNHILGFPLPTIPGFREPKETN